MDKTDYRHRIYERYASGLGTETDTEEPGRQPYFAMLAKLHLPDRNADVLELGAGSGGFLAFLAARGFSRLTGIDGSPEQVALARKRGAPVALGDVLQTLRAAPDASRDVIVALDVIEHFSKAEAFELLAEACRVLSPGGRCIIHTVNADSPFFGTVRYGDFTHETAFNRNSITQVLRTVGFGEVRCYEDRPIVHGAKSLARAAVWQMARSAASLVLAAETGVLSGDRVLSQNFLTVAVRAGA